MGVHYGKKFFKKLVIFRPHNVYGPNMGWEHVIPEIIKKIFFSTNYLKNKSGSIEIQGSGNETRSFCYIDDAIDSLMLLNNQGENNEIYNIGNDHEISIIELINYIQEHLGTEISIVTKNLSKGSTKRRNPNLKKIKKLGFKNKVNIKDGLKKTIDWYLKNINKLN